jgi:hypothetical protein
MRKNKIKYIQAKHKLPLKPSYRDGKHQIPPSERSKTSHIKGFGKNVSQLPLCINVFYHCLLSQYGLSGSGIPLLCVSLSHEKLCFRLGI